VPNQTTTQPKNWNENLYWDLKFEIETALDKKWRTMRKMYFFNRCDFFLQSKLRCELCFIPFAIE
jgi:hypothetical protein